MIGAIPPVVAGGAMLGAVDVNRAVVLAAADDSTPWWLTLIVAVIALSGTVLSAVLVRQSSSAQNVNARLTRIDDRLADMELDKWRHREETMRMLRWAGESAARRDNPALAAVGVAALDALGSSELLQPEDQAFIEKVLDAILQNPVAAYHEAEDAGAGVEVVEVVEVTDGSEP